MKTTSIIKTLKTKENVISINSYFYKIHKGILGIINFKISLRYFRESLTFFFETTIFSYSLPSKPSFEVWTIAYHHQPPSNTTFFSRRRLRTPPASTFYVTLQFQPPSQPTQTLLWFRISRQVHLHILNLTKGFNYRALLFESLMISDCPFVYR